ALVLGGPAWVRKLLARGASAKGAGALREAVAAAADRPLLVAGMNPAGVAAAVKKSGAQGKPYLPLFHARSWQARAGVNKGLTLDLRLRFGDEAAAKAAVPALSAALNQLDRYFTLCEKEMPAFFKRQSAKYKQARSLARPMAETIASARKAI